MIIRKSILALKMTVLVTTEVTSFSANPFISGKLLKAAAFMVTLKMTINALTFCF